MKAWSERQPEERAIPVSPTILLPALPEGVKVELFVGPELMPSGPALEQLRRLATASGIRDPIVALPDVHAKERNLVPTGIVVATRDRVFPSAVDKGINCGMRILATSIPATACNPARLDALFAEIQRRVPIESEKTNVLDKREVMQAFRQGAAWAAERFHLDAKELQAIERRGNLFDQDLPDLDSLRRSLPSAAIKKARRGLGALGGGNHFLEAQEVVQLLDAEKARHLGLEKGNLVFMVHTGSCSVSSQVMRKYALHVRSRSGDSRFQEAWERLSFHAQGESFSPRALAATWPEIFARSPFYSFPVESSLGRRFLLGIHAAANFGFVNRMAITEALRESLRRLLGSGDTTARLLVDCSHVTIQKEEHHGESLWIHRHGSNVALPPSRCGDHPLWRHTGQPIPVPGSMGDDSYIAVGAEGNASTYHSANHGAGRLLDKPEAIARWTEEDVEREMRQRHVRLYRGRTMSIAEQAPGSFKNVVSVMDAMQRFRIAVPVARVRPLAVLKG